MTVNPNTLRFRIDEKRCIVCRAECANAWVGVVYADDWWPSECGVYCSTECGIAWCEQVQPALKAAAVELARRAGLTWDAATTAERVAFFRAAFREIRNIVSYSTAEKIEHGLAFGHGMDVLEAERRDGVVWVRYMNSGVGYWRKAGPKQAKTFTQPAPFLSGAAR